MEEVDIVDAHDTIVSTTTKEEAHQKELLHRVTIVMVFNPDGVGNRSSGRYWVEGREVYVFEANPSQAQYWRVADAIEFLSVMVPGASAISEMTIKALEGMSEGQVLRDVEVTGLSLAVSTCDCQRPPQSRHQRGDVKR